MLKQITKRLFSSSRILLKDDWAKILSSTISEIHEAGTYKHERVITTPQTSEIGVQNSDSKVLNFCANNYLGLSNNQDLINGSISALNDHGLGMSSVRFICGTQDIHKELEKMISEFHGTEDTILYTSCFDANAGFFEACLTPEDAIISDSLNHASIIDGIRLCKAERYRFNHMDMKELEEILIATQDKRLRVIATDGVFSMDGDIAPLDEIVELKNKYDAYLFVDESHATGFMGPTGRGVPEYFGVADQVDIINSTLGKALGGASGGYSTGRADVIELLRQKSRPYLFSNSIAPPIVGSTIEALKLIMNNTELRDKLAENTALFRGLLGGAGFNILGNKDCPIVPILLEDARLANEFADEMLGEDIYVIGFSFPVVPMGQARIRVQLSAGHTTEQVEKTAQAFINIGKKKGVIA